MMKKIEQQDIMIQELLTRGTHGGWDYVLKEQESKFSYCS